MPRKWAPRRCGLLRLQPRGDLPSALKLWKRFVDLNRHILSPVALLYAFVEQKLKAGLAPSTVRSRVETIMEAGIPVSLEAFDRLQRHHHLASLKKYLLQLQNSTGVRHKVPWALSIQTTPLSYPERPYTVWWFVLLATGLRPGNLWHAEIFIEDTKIKIFCLQGTKSNPKRMRRPRVYDFMWSIRPPGWALSFFKENRMLPRIAKKETIASHINSWLKRNKPPVPITSCCPRARMDQILRKLVSEGHMTTDEYEWLLDHTIETSNESYFAQL